MHDTLTFLSFEVKLYTMNSTPASTWGHNTFVSFPFLKVILKSYFFLPHWNSSQIVPVYFKRIRDKGACNSFDFKGGYWAILVWLWSVYNHITFWQVSFRIWHPLKEGTIAAAVWDTRIMIEQMRCFFSLVPLRPWWIEFILQNS